MAFYIDYSVRNILHPITNVRKMKRLNFSIYLFENKQIPFSDKPFSQNVS